MTRHRPVDRARSLVLASLAAALLVAACGSSTGTAGPSAPAGGSVGTSPQVSPVGTGSAATAGTTVGEERIEDLDRLFDRLVAVHPNPFLEEGEDAFRARVAAIEARADTLTDIGFLVAVMGLMGHRQRDGHSGAWAFAQPSELLSAWPLWLWDFPDGLRVVAARKPYSDLVGACVTAVGHDPVEAARHAVEPLVPMDNASSLRANLPTFLLLPDVLTELGVLAPGDPGLTLAMADGSTREVTPEPMPIDAYRDWIFGAYGGEFPEGLPPDPDGPPHLRHRELAFWSETVARPAAIYVGYNAVTSRTSAGRSLADLVTELQTAADAEPDRPVVVDLRNNGGGDNNTYRPLRTLLETIAAADPGRVRLITGRSTFSAAGNFVTDLLVGPQRAGITLVGEPPGGGLDMYGDVAVVTLPNSKIVVLISRRYHERAPGDDRLQIEPNVPAEVGWEDYAARRDPVLDAAAKP
jgi:hypothetical protein